MYEIEIIRNDKVPLVGDPQYCSGSGPCSIESHELRCSRNSPGVRVYVYVVAVWRPGGGGGGAGAGAGARGAAAAGRRRPAAVAAGPALLRQNTTHCTHPSHIYLCYYTSLYKSEN